MNSNLIKRLKNTQSLLHTILRSERDPSEDICYPNKLYHYTTVEGAIGILQNNTIFASNAMFLNDSTELVYGKELIVDAINKVIKDDNFSTTYYFGFSDNEIEILKSVLLELEKTNLNDIYISCFTSQSDMLSQWRGYSSGGVRIGFDIEKLYGLNDVHVSKIDYIRSTQLKNIENTLAVLLTYLHTDLDPIYSCFPLIPEGKDVLSADRDIIPKVIAMILLSNVSSFKIKGFKEEREYRLIYDINSHYNKEKSKAVKYRSNGKFIVPYIELKFDKLLPITDIMVGQSPYSDKIKHGLELLLKSEGYNNVKVNLSKIPYIP